MKKFFIGIALVSGAMLASCSSEKAETAETATDDISNDETAVEAVAEATDDTEGVEEAVAAPAPAWMPEGVTMLPSGLGIVIENPGDDTRATRTSPVTLHYRGRLSDGTVFDSSYDRGVPATFSATQVIPGFGEGIMQIGRGGKATLYIPSNLGYGPQGVPGSPIGPDANLIFDIEILDIR